MSLPYSCDTSVAVGPATTDGAVIFAKNSDRAANECQPLTHVPRQAHAAGALAQCQYLAIPQVAETWEMIGSRPHWLWGFEMGVNEWGVAIGNEAVHSREPYEEPAALIGMDALSELMTGGKDLEARNEDLIELLEGALGPRRHHL